MVLRQKSTNLAGVSNEDPLSSIIADIKKNPELRNSMLSLLYDLYKKEIGFKGSFDEFILEPIKLYRGVTDADKKGKGQEGFSAYSISKNRVIGYAHNRSSENPEVREVTVRPIDTYGAVNYIMDAEVEVLLPQNLSKELSMFLKSSK